VVEGEGNRYLLDEDLPPAVAGIARNLGLDVVSVHEIDRRGLSDRQQFQFAIESGRILLTRNRNDFLQMYVADFQAGLKVAGLLIVSKSLPNRMDSRIAHTLARWHEARGGAESFVGLDFLSG